MSTEIKAPVFPESVAEGTVATWHKQPGEACSRDELIVDIETDKVVMEDSLELALAELTGDRSFAAGSGDSPSSAGPTTTTPGATTPASSDTVEGQIGNVSDALDSIKLDIETLEEALERLKELTGGQ